MSGANIDRFPETLALVLLGPGTDVPRWAESSSVFTITATATETSVLCAARNVPGKARAHRPLTAFVVRPTEHSARTALTASLLTALVDIDVAPFVVDTFEHPWLLVPADQADAAEEEWRRRGHTVAPAVPADS